METDSSVNSADSDCFISTFRFTRERELAQGQAKLPENMFCFLFCFFAVVAATVSQCFSLLNMLHVLDVFLLPTLTQEFQRRETSTVLIAMPLQDRKMR